MSKKSEVINLEAIIDKCDQIGGSKLVLQNKARNIKKTWMEQADANVEAVRDFIFGISDENPFEDLNTEVQEKFDAYDEKLRDLAEKASKVKLKRKINK